MSFQLQEISWILNKIENKLKGLEELNKIRRKVAITYGKDDTRGISESERNNNEVYWITYDYLISWISKNGIKEMIFINSVHPELIRRSYNIINMLAKEEKLDNEYLEIIWNNTRTSHEETVRATLELIQKVAENLNMKWLQFIFKKVKEIPNNEYNEIMIDFLRDYTFSAMNNYTTREREGSGNIFQDAYKWLQTKKNISDKHKYFSIDKFWDIANDDLVTKQDIKDKALNYLIEILGSANCNIDSKIYFLNQSIDKIISGDKYVESWRLFKSIASKFNMTNQKESEAFHKINETYGGFVTLIIQKHEEIVNWEVSNNFAIFRNTERCLIK